MPFSAYLNIKKILILYTEILRFYFFAARAARNKNFHFLLRFYKLLLKLFIFSLLLKKMITRQLFRGYLAIFPGSNIFYPAIFPGYLAIFPGSNIFYPAIFPGLPGNFSGVPGNFSGVKYF